MHKAGVCDAELWDNATEAKAAPPDGTHLIEPDRTPVVKDHELARSRGVARMVQREVRPVRERDTS